MRALGLRRAPPRQEPAHHHRPARGRRGRRTWSSGTFTATAPEPAVGRRHHLRADLVAASSTSRSSSTCSPAGSWAGRCPPVAAHRPGPGRPGDGALERRPRRRTTWPGWSTTPTAASSTCRSATPSASPRPARRLGRLARRLLRQRPGRGAQRAVQDRADPPPRALARLDDVEFGTLEWVDWFNNRRLHGACGHTPPTEHEKTYYRHNPAHDQRPEPVLQNRASTEPGAVQARWETAASCAGVIESGWNGSRMVFDMACSPAI